MTGLRMLDFILDGIEVGDSYAAIAEREGIELRHVEAVAEMEALGFFEEQAGDE